MQIKPLLSQSLPKSLALFLCRLKIMIVLIFLASFLLPTNVLAQCEEGQITIDGNPCDWDNTSIIPIRAYVLDAYGTGPDNQFTLGSKDDDLASALRWNLGSTKSKGDIANAAAVLIDNKIYFAGDRTSNLGAAQIGFWFYLGGTGPNIRPDGTMDSSTAPVLTRRSPS